MSTPPCWGLLPDLLHGTHLRYTYATHHTRTPGRAARGLNGLRVVLPLQRAHDWRALHLVWLASSAQDDTSILYRQFYHAGPFHYLAIPTAAFRLSPLLTVSPLHTHAHHARTMGQDGGGRAYVRRMVTCCLHILRRDAALRT